MLNPLSSTHGNTGILAAGTLATGTLQTQPSEGAWCIRKLLPRLNEMPEK